MFIKKFYSKIKRYKSLINYCFYSIFLFYMVYLISKESTFTGTIPYLLVLLLFGSLATLNEYLKNLYAKSILLLTDQCDPLKALVLIEQIERFDILKAYKNTIIIFKLLALRDLGQYSQLLTYINTLDINKLKLSKDHLLTYNYTLFMTYINVKDDDKVSFYYKELVSMKKSNKYPPLFSWNEIIGTYHLYNNNLSECKKYYNKVKTNKMNKREYVHFSFNLGNLYFYLKNYNDCRKYLNLVVSKGASLQIGYESIKILGSINKEATQPIMKVQ